jgi:hypothetical protein
MESMMQISRDAEKERKEESEKMAEERKEFAAQQQHQKPLNFKSIQRVKANSWDKWEARNRTSVKHPACSINF